MSRIGNRVLNIPNGVTVTLDGNKMTVKGPKGELSKEFNKDINIEVKENTIVCTRANDNTFTKSIHGTTNALIKNMLTGVSEGFVKELDEINREFNAHYEVDDKRGGNRGGCSMM